MGIKVVGSLNNQLCICFSRSLLAAVDAISLYSHPILLLRGTSMENPLVTQPHPVVRAAQSAVLLIFFMPTNLINHLHRALLTELAGSIQAQFGSLLRVLQIDEAENPDVVTSFGIAETPTFVLVKQGIELWRQVGLCTEERLVNMIRPHITDNASAGNQQAA